MKKIALSMALALAFLAGTDDANAGLFNRGRQQETTKQALVNDSKLAKQIDSTMVEVIKTFKLIKGNTSRFKGTARSFCDKALTVAEKIKGGESITAIAQANKEFKNAADEGLDIEELVVIKDKKDPQTESEMASCARTVQKLTVNEKIYDKAVCNKDTLDEIFTYCDTIIRVFQKSGISIEDAGTVIGTMGKTKKLYSKHQEKTVSSTNSPLKDNTEKKLEETVPSTDSLLEDNIDRMIERETSRYKR